MLYLFHRYLLLSVIQIYYSGRWRKCAGLGARDTLRLEAALPLYGHEMGTAPDGSEIPIFAVPLSKFAVSFAAEKGDFIGRKALEKQHESFIRHMDRDFSDLTVLPRKIAPIALLDRGVMRGGMEIYKNGALAGWVARQKQYEYYRDKLLTFKELEGEYAENN